MPLDEELQYWVGRSGQTFGPYSAGEVRDYVRSGNIAPSDYLRSDRDTDWRTVAEVMGLAAPPPMPGAGSNVGTLSRAGQATADTLAVWSLVLAGVSVLCCGIFASVPGAIVAMMALRRPPESARTLAMIGLIANVLATILGIVLIFLGPMIANAILRNMGMPPGGGF
ncbi:MAG: GYF domain-containing protein [Phycisphaerales bacterium]